MNLPYLHEDIAIKTLSVPSVTRWEQMMRDFLITFADEHEMEHEVDSTGNVYLTKGNIMDNEYLIPYVDRMHDVHNEDDEFFFEKFGRYW